MGCCYRQITRMEGRAGCCSCQITWMSSGALRVPPAPTLHIVPCAPGGVPVGSWGAAVSLAGLGGFTSPKATRQLRVRGQPWSWVIDCGSCSRRGVGGWRGHALLYEQFPFTSTAARNGDRACSATTSSGTGRTAAGRQTGDLRNNSVSSSRLLSLQRCRFLIYAIIRKTRISREAKIIVLCIIF